MRQLWFVMLVVLAVAGIALSFYVNSQKLGDGQAGRALRKAKTASSLNRMGKEQKDVRKLIFQETKMVC